eukprot:275133_1
MSSVMNAYRFITVLVASSYIIEAAARDFIHIKRNDYLDDFGQSNFGGYNLVLVDLLHEGKVPTGIKVPIQQLTIAKADLDESAQLQTLRTFVGRVRQHILCVKKTRVQVMIDASTIYKKKEHLHVLALQISPVN